MFESEVGTWLASCRQSKGLSQEALGTMIGKGQSDIAKVELGKRRVSLVEVIEWMDALSISRSELILFLDNFFNNVNTKSTFWKNGTDK
ncbi:MAG: helix-turn-helix transcriptional regulator [Crocinitomicaceae bacterium]|nr:helix-turn-helix domain-containing protein [Flavobacteriales bacterium]NQZ35999.1 helix-turn-helix transcriptional regulator [Crocinitomicaceae bacterium]